MRGEDGAFQHLLCLRVGEGRAEESPTPNYTDSSSPKGDGGSS